MGRGLGTTMHTLFDTLEYDRWQSVAQVIDRVAAATRTQPRAIRTSLRRLQRRGLIAVAPRRLILPDLGGTVRLVRRTRTDPDDEAVAQHSALVRLCYDELLATRNTLVRLEAGSGAPRDWWQARDRAHELRRVLSRLVGRRELRRLLHAAGYPGDTPLSRPMPLYAMAESA